MNDEGVYRTAPATPGLLKIREWGHQTHKQTDIAPTRPTRPRGAELVKTLRVQLTNGKLCMYNSDMKNIKSAIIT